MITGVTYSKLVDKIRCGGQEIQVYKIRMDDVECLSLEQEPANSVVIPIDGLGQVVEKLAGLLNYYRPPNQGPGPGQRSFDDERG